MKIGKIIQICSGKESTWVEFYALTEDGRIFEYRRTSISGSNSVPAHYREIKEMPE